MNNPSKEVVCPKCGCPVNQLWFKTIVNEYDEEEKTETEFALFIAECWNPLAPEKSHYHKFKVFFELVGEVEVDKDGLVDILKYEKKEEEIEK